MERERRKEEKGTFEEKSEDFYVYESIKRFLEKNWEFVISGAHW